MSTSRAAALPMARPSSWCLDDPGATLQEGTQLQIFDCNKTAAQRWRIP
ncbi:hypothetical protein [Streptomyces mirabilis]